VLGEKNYHSTEVISFWLISHMDGFAQKPWGWFVQHRPQKSIGMPLERFIIITL
jgi:hypothetical protein